MNKRRLAVLLTAMVLCCTINIHAEGEKTQEKPLTETVQESKALLTEAMREPEETVSETRQKSEEASSETEQEIEETSSETMGKEPEETSSENAREPEEASSETGKESEETFSETVWESEKASSETAQEIEKASSESADDPEKTLQSVSENALSQPETVLEDSEPLYSVSFPTRTKAYLDPGDVSGEGQIFSEHYKVENYGNTDVSITIKHISIRCLSDKDAYAFTEEEVIDPRSAIKKLRIDMVWEDESGHKKILHISDGTRDEEVLFLKAASYDKEGNFISLMDGGTGSFYFTGAVNGNPGLQWEDGEIAITFSYEITEVKAETH